MSTAIADLFINLGIKGAEKTVGAVSKVKTGLSDVASTSLEAKAAIVGLIYGLEQMMARSAQLGNSMTQFGDITGLNTVKLYQYGYAAQQAGSSLEETMASVKNAQSQITNARLHHAELGWLNIIAQYTGGVDYGKAMDPFYLLQKFQAFSRKAPAALVRDVGARAGFGEGTIAAAREGVFNQTNFSKAPKYTQDEFKRLQAVKVGWSNLWSKTEKAFADINADKGPKFIEEISGVTDKLLGLVNALTQFSEKAHVFQWIGKIIEGWGNVFELMGIAIDKVNGVKPDNDQLTDAAKKVLKEHGVAPGDNKFYNMHPNLYNKLPPTVNVQSNHSHSHSVELDGAKIPHRANSISKSQHQIDASTNLNPAGPRNH